MHFCYSLLRLCRGVAVVLVTSPGVLSSSSAEAQKLPSADEIRAAAPESPHVPPAKPRKVLVFSLPKGFVHPSIPVGEKAIQILGEKTGAFTTVATRDPEMFRPENLQQFDAVVMNNISGEPFTDPELRDSLLRFVRDEGKGLVGIHGATTAFREWPEYGSMLGAYFNTHPWSAGDTVTLKIEDPGHPLTAAFAEPTLTLVEEIYQFKNSPYSRSRLRVLVSLDTEKTDMTKPGIDRFDNDFPVSWVRTHGQGRVFYSSLGHNYAIYTHPAILQHFLDGIQFALGDLDAPTEPRREIAEAILIKALPERLQAVRGYTFGADRRAQANLDELISEASHYPAVRRHFAAEIGKLLSATVAERQSSASLALEQYLARKLGELGTEEAAAALAPLLEHEEALLAEAAYLALGEIREDAAGDVLRKALSSAPPEYRAGIAAVLGHRRDSKAVPLLASLALDESGTTAARAALFSLGEIATPEAAAALKTMAKSSASVTRASVTQARLACASTLAREGHTKLARQEFREILGSAESSTHQAAALLGLASLGGADNRTLVIRAFMGDDPELASAAVAFLTQDRNPETGQAIVHALSEAPPEIQILGLRILADRRESGALDFVREKAQGDENAVRLAAIKALGALGNSSVVELLASRAASGDPAERKAARGSLAAIKSEGVNEAILNLLERSRRDAGPETARFRQELVAALEQRHAEAAVPALLEAATDPDAGVRKRAFTALAALAGGDQTEQLVALLSHATPASVRKEAEKAVVASALRLPDENAREDAAVEALGKVQDPGHRASLIRVLGKIGTPGALQALQQQRSQGAEAEQVQDALVRAIAEFPTAEAFPEALRLARDSENDLHQVLALRGAARMLALPVKERSSTETLRLWSELMALARGPEEQKMILGEVAETKEAGLLPFAVEHLENPALKNEAVAAALELAEKTCHSDPDGCREALLKVEKAADEAGRKKVAAIRSKIGMQKKP